MTTIYMIQVAPQRWQLESQSGAILKDDLLMNSQFDAEKYVREYISSFPAWIYKMKPLAAKGKEK